MKKHPVDDLFKRRLAELEKTPSVAAWEKIQTKTKKERRLAGWVWYAAASVVIAFIAGYAVWNGQHSNMEMIGKGSRIAVLPKSAKPTQVEQKNSVKNIEEAGKEVPAKAVELAVNNAKPESGAKDPISPNNTKVNVAKADQIDVPEKLDPVDIEIKQESIAAVPNVEVSPEIKAVIPAKVTPEPNAEPTRTIVVAVQTHDQESEDKHKSSRFSKVFRQLKNARAGERVDWEEVGFNPKSLVAKVDDRLRNGEEKVSEKYQNLKDKTKL